MFDNRGALAGDSGAVGEARRRRQKMTSDRALEAKAARIHALCALRHQQFAHPPLNDQGMSIMLTLFIAQIQGLDLKSAALGQANDILHQPLEALLQQLIQAGLVEVTGRDPATQSVGLSPIGSARMRSYIDAFPAI
jgi:hypothetical protein